MKGIGMGGRGEIEKKEERGKIEGGGREEK